MPRRKNNYVIQGCETAVLLLLLVIKNIEAATGGAEAVTRGILQKQVLLKISRTSQKNTCIVVFFNKVAGLQPASFLKGDSNANAFL